jgi:2-polyprenyl-3-methyl-5-hydroxy-6-metoxy-1,4-benzoquinol methylase
METFEISVKRFNDFAVEYAERFNSIDSYVYSINRFCDLISLERPKILELACGPGNITKHVKQRFPNSDYIAVDLAEKMIDIAREQVDNVDFRIMDMKKISTFKTKFDSIMCSFGLPFLSKKDAYTLILNCSKLLHNNGVIYLSSMEGDELKAGFESTSFSGDSKVYFNYHRQKDIEKALVENGFHIDMIKRQNYIEPDGSVMTDMIFIAVKKYEYQQTQQ